MNTKIRFVLSIALLIFPMLLTACAPAASDATPTVTVSGNTCTYSGPSQIPSQASFTWDIQDSGSPVNYQFLAVALSESQSVEDLRSLTSLPQTFSDIPAEFNHMFYVEVVVAGKSTKEVDFGTNAAFKGEPVYIVCGNDYNNIGVVGPFEVAD